MSVPAESEQSGSQTPARKRRWIKITSRMGVWGLVLATTPALSELIGFPMDPSLTGPIGAAGLLTSGLGVLLASSLVLRALPEGVRPLKLAAFAGVPFGIALLLGGAAVLRPLGFFADAIDAAGPLVLVIGIILVLLLLAGFVQGHKADETE